MRQTFVEMTQRNLIRKFYTLLNKCSNSNEIKQAIFDHYNITSTKELTCAELVEICDILDKQIHKEIADLDVWRKRVIASIAGYLQLVERDCNIKIIKAIAMRATGYDDFNNIPRQRLINLYNAFLNKQKDTHKVNECLYIDSLIKNYSTDILN